VMFQVAGYSSVALAALSWMLPHTPPPAAGKQVSLGETLGLGAIGMLARPSFAVFMLCSFLTCIPLAGSYAFGNQFAATAFENPGFYMTFGQWAEVLFMLVMPVFFVRLGVKWMLAIGMLAWVVRYGLFGLAAGESTVAWMALAGILLHGICYDFFFVTGQIYVDQRCRPEIRGQAQSLLVIVTQGLGLFLGAKVMTAIVNENTTDAGVADWRTIWLWPCAGAAAILVVFVLLFRERRAEPAAPAHGKAPATR
jgi:MFS family permease